MKQKLLVTAISMILAAPVMATNGIFSVGIGQSAKGSGGAGVAYPQDTLTAGINPAGMVHLGDRLDAGLELFKPSRGFDFGGANYSGNDTSKFFIPEFGYNKMWKPDVALGISVIGTGGMNTDYSFHPFLGGAASINMEQLQVLPTVAIKVSERHSFGLSAILAIQRVKIKGLGAFSGLSYAPGSVTDNGNVKSTGIGVRLGWMGKMTDRLTLGAAYQPRINMSELKGYRGLFPGGTVDIPENYTVGLAFKATPKLDVLLDIARISFGDARVLGNPTAGLGGQLGQSTGPGFGWEDQTVYKLGLVYKHSNKLTLRGGYNYGKNPVPNGSFNDFFFNSLAPGITEKHVTLGATYAFDKKMSITGSYIKTLNKSTDYSAVAGPGASLNMKQDALGVSLNITF